MGILAILDVAMVFETSRVTAFSYAGGIRGKGGLSGQSWQLINCEPICKFHDFSRCEQRF